LNVVKVLAKVTKRLLFATPDIMVNEDVCYESRAFCIFYFTSRFVVW